MADVTDVREASAWLAQCRRPLLVTHRRPDGDALGCLAAMNLALRHLRLAPEVVLFEPFPRRYAFLEPSARWLQWEFSHDVLMQECDAVVVLDTCSNSQLEPIADWLPAAPRTLVIDHHATRDAIAVRPGDLRIVDESAGACCLLVAEWVRAAGVPLTRELASALFTGIGTDCGWFRFSNTDARLMRAAADLLGAGVSSNEIYNLIYQQDPPAKLRLIARMMSGMELLADGRLVVLALRQADFAAAGADDTMTEDLVNEPSRLAGTEVTLLFTEEPRQIRLNLRSKARIDVAEIARYYGGGGHARAAGARLNGAWDDVVPRVVAQVRELVERS